VKRLILVLGVLLLALAGFGQAPAATMQPAKKEKVTICHRTPSQTHPYVLLSVSRSALKRGHAGHAQDIIPAPAGGCPTILLSPTQGGTALSASLTGSAEVPGPGDPNGSGQATIRLVAGEGRLCFQLSASNIMLPATAAHIHIGAIGTAGNVVVPLTPPDATGSSAGCVNVARPLVNAILANPAAYYANVHTSEFPDGAIRGQLTA
jgi:CHRD domain